MAEVIFWLAALAGGIGFLIYAKLQPADSYYEGRMDKIGGKGGR